MKKVLFGLFLILFGIIIIFIVNIKIEKELISVELEKCVDGDTAWFKLNGKSKKYRFLAINAPEVDTTLGKSSKEFVCGLLNNSKNIKIEYDDVGEIRDKYKRELVWVYVDNELLQEKILEEGLAEIKYIYAKYKYIDKLISVENNSKINKYGIWEEYDNKTYTEYYTLRIDDLSEIKEEKVLKNSMFIIDNPIKKGCKFIGWKNINKLFDLSTKIKKDYNLVAKYEC